MMAHSVVYAHMKAMRMWVSILTLAQEEGGEALRAYSVLSAAHVWGSALTE